MNVAIIGRQNGSGLEKDKRILLELLNSKGICTSFRTIDIFEPLTADTDVCIFTEVVDTRYYGRKNILIPNQEWFHKRWISELAKFDAIFCKSEFAVDLFEEYHSNVIYTGFTSLDFYNGKTKRPLCFHSQGQSGAKGTSIVIEAWQDKSLPSMQLITSLPATSNENLTVWNSKLPESEYIELINECLVHVYPCLTEGFGHCINEAKACGCVVITTDFPPMNELINEQLVKVGKVFEIPDRLGYCGMVNADELTGRVKEIFRDNDLEMIGYENRKDFLKKDIQFKERFIYELMRL